MADHVFFGVKVDEQQRRAVDAHRTGAERPAHRPAWHRSTERSACASSREDLERLFDFVLERELAREGGDLELAEEALAAVTAGLKALERFPFTCRKAADSPFFRELIIPFGSGGHVALFEVVDGKTVVVAALRHQREDDYH